MIEVRHLSKRYGDHSAVRDLSFQVARGEVVGFLGPNGAGKSTTLRMLTGFLEATSGEIRIDGIDASTHGVEVRKRIGYMPEAVPLHLELRVVEYLRFRAELKGVPRRKLTEHIDRALALAAVAEVKDRIIGQLSKGTKQRVGLADALVADPPLLILDEPTAGLDPNQIRQVRDLIRTLSKEKTVLLSTHILPEVEATCGRVIIIDRGRLLSTGRPDELRGPGGGLRVLRIEARASEEALRAALAGLGGLATEPELARVGASDDTLRARLTVDGAFIDDTAEAVFRAMAQANIALRELAREDASLEEVFARLTTHEPEGQPKPEVAA